MPLKPGHRLLHYEIVERIGEGGMGVVWKAVDTTLQREVAIKVLPAALAQDSERLARFDREAKLLASLSHANIAAVFGLHEAPSTASGPALRFLAMEYVAGEDLSQRMQRGRIPLRESLGIARQIADALQSAHESGVVHRDLKPANVMLTPEGEVKVLDFGLAKAFEADPSAAVNPSMSPTLTSHGTIAGVILGTAGYMSPEQARGHAADKRSDVWSFGVVLYEMVTGARAFHGDTVSDTLASVLKLEPDWHRLSAELPRGVARLLKRCLQKDPRERLHDIADARIEIVDALEKPREAVQTAAAEAPSRVSRVLAAGLAVLGLAAGGLVGWSLKPEAPEPPVRRFVIRSDDVTKPPENPRISPDGIKIVYRQGERWYVRDLQGWESRPIEGSDGAEDPFWSPDSSSIAYHARGKLWRVELASGTSTAICEQSKMREAAWNEAGTIGIVEDNKMLEVSSRGGEPKVVLDLSDANVSDFHGIDALPGDHGWVVVVHESDGTFGVEVVRGTERKRLVKLENATLWAPRYAHPGYVLYRRFGKNQGIWAVPFALAAGEPTGAPFLVSAAGHDASASRDGTLIYRPGGAVRELELVRVGRDGMLLETLGQPQMEMLHPTLSPDGTRVLVSAQENEQWDLWIHDVTRGTKTRLTADDDREAGARWSSDGEQVYFYSPVGNSLSKIYSVSADGSGEPRELAAGHSPSLSADGRWMVFVRDDPETEDDLWSWLDDGSEPQVFLATDAGERRPSLSPNGKWLAYASDDSGREEVYIKPFPSGPGKWQASVDGGTRPNWSPDGTRVYFSYRDQRRNELFEVDVKTGSSLVLSVPRIVLDFDADPVQKHRINVWRGYEMYPDGQSVLTVRPLDDGEEKDENAMPDGIFVVQNWLAE